MENGKRRMGGGKWLMENRERRIGNRESGIGNGVCAMEKKNGELRMKNQVFAGNIDEYFRNGISVMKKCVKLYAKYPSVVTVASPLGLRMMIIGSAGYF